VISMGNNILEINNLYKYFPIKSGFFTKPKSFVKAVDGVSLNIKKGEVLGIVGESGCGKTTLVNTILNLESPTKGKVVFNGKNLFDLSKNNLRKTRKDIQIVFQDPFWSLNPRMLVKDIISEPLKVQTNIRSNETLKKVEELLEMVGLPKESAFLFPHEFSNGQRQRIAIARALSLMPKLVVLDEPTSSIDVISQAQILDLLIELKGSFNLTYIIISHDLSVINYMSDKIAVMYLGKLVEYGDANIIFKDPSHPYTKALFDAIPNLEIKNIEDVRLLKGNVPSAINLPSGCRFHERCPYAVDKCKQQQPELKAMNNGIMAACHVLNTT